MPIVVRPKQEIPQKDLTQSQKKAIMFTGIGIIMAALIVLWAHALRSSLAVSAQTAGKDSAAQMFGKMQAQWGAFTTAAQDAQNSIGTKIDQTQKAIEAANAAQAATAAPEAAQPSPSSPTN